MKTYKNLYEQVISFANLDCAFHKAFKGTKSSDAYKFEFNKENEICKLRRELMIEEYKPQKYYSYKIFDPKERDISVAPFRDRVIHHAIVNVIEPIFEKIFIYDSYACRCDKGTHKAVERAQNYLKNNYWYLKQI